MELWLDEQLELVNGRALKMRVLKTLDSVKTPFQQIDVFQTQAFGKVFNCLSNKVILRIDFLFIKRNLFLVLLNLPRRKFLSVKI